jgi:geranylgeranyl pyrophosphate synthase
MLASVRIDDDRRLSEREARDIVDAVRAGDGPQRALEMARDHARAARDQLSVLDGNEGTSTLVALTDYVVTRKF